MSYRASKPAAWSRWRTRLTDSISDCGPIVVTETDHHLEYQRNAPSVQAGLYVVPRVIE